MVLNISRGFILANQGFPKISKDLISRIWAKFAKFSIHLRYQITCRYRQIFFSLGIFFFFGEFLMWTYFYIIPSLHSFESADASRCRNRKFWPPSSCGPVICCVFSCRDARCCNSGCDVTRARFARRTSKSPV